MIDAKGNSNGVKTVSVRMPMQYFLTNPPPAGHAGWNLPAFQAYCALEMASEGFDLDRCIHCYYNKQKGEIVFWQNVLEIELSEASWN